MKYLAFIFLETLTAKLLPTIHDPTRWQYLNGIDMRDSTSPVHLWIRFNSRWWLSVKVRRRIRTLVNKNVEVYVVETPYVCQVCNNKAENQIRDIYKVANTYFAWKRLMLSKALQTQHKQSYVEFAQFMLSILSIRTHQTMRFWQPTEMGPGAFKGCIDVIYKVNRPI